MKDIVIKINSNICAEGEEPHLMEMTMPAKFYKKSGHLYISYEETELTGMEGDKTVLKLKGDVITMTRFGSNPSTMVFRENESYETDYTTPYGTFKMENIVSKLTMAIGEEGSGHLEIQYELLITGVTKSDNILRIEIIS